MRIFRSPDGTPWGVQIQTPGASNATVIFRHPDDYVGGRTARRNRYAWYITPGPEARDVQGRLREDRVLAVLTDDELRLLHRRSMLVSTQFEPAPELG